jgi:hypothetical protein
MCEVIIIIIMYKKGLACFLFRDPQDEVGPSISSSVILCFFVLLVYINVCEITGGICLIDLQVVTKTADIFYCMKKELVETAEEIVWTSFS